MTWRRLACLGAVLLMAGDTHVAAAQLARYREPPYGACRFVQDHFKVTLESFQEQVLIAFGKPGIDRISMQAAAGVGKTAVECWCAWYFLATQCLLEHEHPKGLVTGITDANVKDNFWAEMQKWRGVSPFLTESFTWTANRIFANEFPETWFLGRRNWSKNGTADEQGATLSGLHSRSVAAFIDESGGIPTTVLRAAEQALSDRPLFGKLLQGGNPISLEGMLHAAANELRTQWTVIIVTNDPDDPHCSKRGDKEWARTQIDTYGRDNPWVMSYILGKFPPTSLNTLIGLEDVVAAMKRRAKPDDYLKYQKRLGVDVARFGDDRTVIWARQGPQSFNPVELRGADTVAIFNKVYDAKLKWGSELEFVDDTGNWGHGVLDQLCAVNANPVAIVFHAPALNVRYKNRRAEMWIRMCDAIKRGHALPYVPGLVAELTTPTYSFTNGTFLIEEKDQIKKRLGRSPDMADACALTYAHVDVPSNAERDRHGLGKALTESAERD